MAKLTIFRSRNWRLGEDKLTPLWMMAAATAFNLTCSIGMMSTTDGRIEKSTEGGGPTFRVDLKSQRFCSGDCEETRRIAAVTPTTITLTDEDLGPLHDKTEISRESGRYVSVVSADNIRPFVTIGTCRPGIFSGFPAAKF